MARKTTTRDDQGLGNARAWATEIRKMVADLHRAEEADDDRAMDSARERITESALSVEVRSGWYSPGCDDDRKKPEEGCILLSTGGPALRIRCNLDEYGYPSDAIMEHQDWGTPWIEYHPGSADAKDILYFASQFWFGS